MAGGGDVPLPGVWQGEVVLMADERKLYCYPFEHEWEPFIDPKSGLFRRCKKCGLEEDLEDPDGDIG